MTRFTLRHSCALGALATAALSATPALAQAEVETAGAATQNENRIVVTGSYIRGTPEDAALPVDVFTADDLAEQGVDSPLEFIKELPSVGASLGDTNQFSTDAQGFQGVGSLNLRGLGPQRTLVLLNGKRTILSPGAGFVDTQLMPLFALERIELLKDGAGSTYGSDAIAGVANFITRSTFTGLEVQGDYNFIDGSDDNYSLSALAGSSWATRAISSSAPGGSTAANSARRSATSSTSVTKPIPRPIPRWRPRGCSQSPISIRGPARSTRRSGPTRAVPNWAERSILAAAISPMSPSTTSPRTRTATRPSPNSPST